MRMKNFLCMILAATCVVQEVGAGEITVIHAGWLLAVPGTAPVERQSIYGIRNLAYASDAGVYTWGKNAGDFVEFVQRGMSQSDAILTATRNAARMLILEDQLGSIEPGEKADIIATAGNPLDNISALMRIHFVMCDGVIYRLDNDSTAALRVAAEVFSP